MASSCSSASVRALTLSRRAFSSSSKFHTFERNVKGSGIESLKSAKRIILLGAPGAGKGTYANLISPMLNIPHISTGDLIRDEIASGRNERFNEIISQGNLLGDDEVLPLLQERLKQPDAQQGFLLDGFPRKASQIAKLDDICQVDAALEIHLREDVLVEKITKRRVCAGCGKNYNLADISIPEDNMRMPPLLPKVEGVCDSCGSTDELLQRSDDIEEVVRHRLATYHETADPIRNAYDERGVLTTLTLTSGIEDMMPVLKQCFGQPE